MKRYILLGSIFTLLFMGIASAKSLDEYAPVLPEVLKKRLVIDPQLGYLVKEVKPDVFLMTDGIWQSVFIKTGKGVILIDAPQSYGQHIKAAVAKVTNESIKMLVYTHSHVDHIGGSFNLKNIPGLKIISSESVAQTLKAKQDPGRLLPTITFSHEYQISMAGTKINLKKQGNYHANDGDLYVYIPDKKFLVVIDSVAPGYVPFMNLDLTTNTHEYLKMFDKVLSYDFDMFVGGHLSHIGNRNDVIESKKYVNDVYQTVKRIHKQTDQMKIMSSAAEKVGWDNKYLLFKTFFDNVIQQCATEIESRWIDKLAGVDVWSSSHCQTLLIYVRWDD